MIHGALARQHPLETLTGCSIFGVNQVTCAGPFKDGYHYYAKYKNGGGCGSTVRRYLCQFNFQLNLCVGGAESDVIQECM